MFVKLEPLYAIAEELRATRSEKIAKAMKSNRAPSSPKRVQTGVKTSKKLVNSSSGSQDTSRISRGVSSRRITAGVVLSEKVARKKIVKNVITEKTLTDSVADGVKSASSPSAARKVSSKTKSKVMASSRKRDLDSSPQVSKSHRRPTVAKKPSQTNDPSLIDDETDLFDDELLSDSDLADCANDSAFGASFDSDKIDDDDFGTDISLVALAKNPSSKSNGKKRHGSSKNDVNSRKKADADSLSAVSLQVPDVAFDYKKGDHVVYCSHGVGEMMEIKNEKVNDNNLKLMVILCRQDRMTLKVPFNASSSSKLRGLSSPNVIAAARKKLQSKSQVSRTLWSRRAQEYSNKIRSGDLCSIAEVVRDLYRQTTRATQSFRERHLSRQAKERLAREIAIVECCDENEVMESIELMMQPSVKCAPVAPAVA